MSNKVTKAIAEREQVKKRATAAQRAAVTRAKNAAAKETDDGKTKSAG